MARAAVPGRTGVAAGPGWRPARTAGWWVWIAPPVVAVAVLAGRSHLALVDAGLVAGALVLAAYLRPRWFVLAVPIVYPFQLFILAGAYRAGLGGSMTRYVGYWIELVALGLAGRAAREHAKRRLDGLDWAALAYIAVVVVYRLAPTFFVAAGPNGPPTAGTVLNTALRNDIFFVVMFLIARHLGLSGRDKRRFATAVFVVGVVVSLGGIYEYLSSASWNHFVVHTLGVTHYQTDVLKTLVPNPDDVRVYTITAGHRLLRVGSVFIDQLECAFFLVAALAAGCEYLARQSRRRGLVALGTLVVAVALVLTQTRDAILAGAVVVALVLRPLSSRDRVLRVQLALLTGLALVLLVPLAVGVGLGTRTTAAINGSDQSASIHVSAITKGVKAFVDQPLGRGLGTGGTNGTRFSVATTLTSEDQYLQVANETGALSLGAFVTLTALVGFGLWKREAAIRSDDGAMPAALWCGAFAGLALAGLFLQVWLSLITAVVVWTGVGLTLAPGPDAEEEAHEAIRPAPVARVGG